MALLFNLEVLYSQFELLFSLKDTVEVPKLIH